MGWILTGLWLALIIVVVAGAALALCRRYCIGWQWSARNVWNVCEEWRQRLSWLWAPREEKVGLVKAQYPTAQTIPGLYRQPGNTSQHLLHSNSDLRIDPQGGFTRFEPVDRDLHPPLGAIGSTIPPQPLRPAPQPNPIPQMNPAPPPKSTSRPRPPPLQPPSTVNYLRMQDTGPGPLTPPPSLQGSIPSRSNGPSFFHFQAKPIKSYGLYKTSNEHVPPFRFDDTTQSVTESIQMTPYGAQNHVDSRLRYELEEERRKDTRCNPYRQFDAGVESTRIRYGVDGAPIATLNGKGDEDGNTSYGSYDIVQRSHMIRQHVRNDSRISASSYGMTNSSNAASQTIMESIYGPAALSKMLQSTQSLGNDLDRKSNEMQSIEMTPFRSSSLQNDIDASYLFRESQGLQKVSQYIQSLPDLPIYGSMNELALHQDQEHVLYDDTMPDSIDALKFNSESASSPVPPPPAPPDPPKDLSKKNGPTTGEKIFNALRLVTSQSYIDAPKFYNRSSVLSAPEQVQCFTFPSRSPSLVDDTLSNQLQNDVRDIYGENDVDVIGPDGSRRSSDLYSPELNLEAHRTAQEVYNSLQNPPSSPLLLKDHHDQETYSYETDPSFTRTSEDILNSIEQRRKSMERQNGILSELNEFDEADSLSFQTQNQDFYGAQEEFLKRKSSQNWEDAFISNYTLNDFNEISRGSRRGPQGPEPEPPPDELDMKRAISCESVCSETSVVFNDLEEKRIVGCVCVTVEYDRLSGRGADSEGELSVTVHEASDLKMPDGQPAQNTFARVCLLPDRQLSQRTKTYRGSPLTRYHEKFLFCLHGGPTGRTLLVEVYSDENCIGSDEILIGEATLPLEPPPRGTGTTTTRLQLVGSRLPKPRLGELMFSLSYSPTAERLTLVVVKAKNLRGASSVSGDFFVKVYLIQQGKKVHKKRTSIKKGENNPIFNEFIIFNVPTHILENIQLRLKVAEINSEQGMKPISVGYIIVGPTSTGNALLHWRQMLAAYRHPVAMWHPLRK
ncbi:uncharacterized protein LOC128888198 [Hylaeus anthracinus]|uniref:uncharacterized protein LOC128888198 n=1 Tax=Hylaeus anthracinus TaxID=313031 RepID=UPI0023B9C5BF|nr:uncharacterized protein LOC128888198 [Hylaeus anthracinus]